MATEFHDVICVGQKIEQVSEWLESTAPLCATEQKHLEEGSQERVYWHYGYLFALREVLRFLTTGSTEVADCAYGGLKSGQCRFQRSATGGPADS